MATEDVVFRGQFDLSDALDDFERFAQEIRKRMGLLSQGLVGKNQQKINQRVEELMGVNEQGLKAVEQKLIAFKKRVQAVVEAELVDRRKAESTVQSLERTVERYIKTLTRLDIKREEGIALTKADIIAMRQLENEMDKFDRTTMRMERNLALTNQQAKESARRFNEFFKGLAIGGFALQNFGAFMTYNVTAPMIRAGKQILDTTLRFDTLEELLSKRGKRSLSEIGATLDTVGRTAKLRNFDLESSVTLYSKLFEATRGAIDDQLFTKVTKGLSEVMSTIEPSEKLGFFGQIQDILGGGNVANLEKTLSLAPKLKSVYDEVAKSAGENANQQTLLLEALGRLSSEAPISDLATKIKNLRVQFELWGERIGRVLKDELTDLIDFIETRVFPVIDRLIVRFEQMSDPMQKIVVAIALITAGLGPLIFTLGTLGVITGGIAYVVRGAATGLGILTGSAKAAAVASADLEVLLAEALETGGVFGRLSTFLVRIPGLINPITLGIAAIVALIGGALVTNAGHARDALVLLWESSTEASKDALSIINDISHLLKVLIVDTGALNVILEAVGTTVAGFFGVMSQSIKLQPTVILIDTLARALRLITDVVDEGAQIALYRFAVSILEVGRSAEQSLPFVARLTEWLFRDNKEGFKSTTEAIDAYKQKIYELGGEVDGHTKRQDELKNKTKEYELTLKTTASSIEAVTKKIQDQQDAVDKLTESLQKQLEAQRDTADEAASAYRIKQLEAAGKAADVGTSAGLAAAQKANQDIYAQELTDTAVANAKIFILNVNAKISEQLTLLAEAQATETNQIYKDFYQDVINTFNKTQGAQLELALEGLRERFGARQPKPGLTLTPTELKIDEILVQAKKYAQAQMQLASTAASLQTENLKAARQRADQRDEELRLRAQEDKAERDEETRVEKLRKQLDTQDKIQRATERIRDALVREFEITQNVDQLIKDLTRTKALLLTNAKRRYDIELQIINGSKEFEAKKEAARNALNRKYNQEKADIGQDITDIRTDQLQKIIERQKTNKKYLEELRQIYLDNLQERVKFATTIAKATGAVDLERTRKQLEEFNAALLSISQEGLSNAIKEMDAVFNQLNLSKTPDLDKFDGFVDLLNSLGMANTAGFLSAEQAKVYTDSIVAFITFLDAVLKTPGITEADAAKTQQTIDAGKKIIKSIQEGQEASVKTVSVKRTELEIREAQLEQELRIKDVQVDQLEIAKRINEERQKGLGRLSVKGVGKDILDAITGGSRAQYELQKKIIEQQIAAAQLETQLAITRLEIDLERLEIEMKRLGYSQAEIDKTKELYKIEIEQLKKRGEMQEELLKQQIDGLQKYGGGITGILSGIVGDAIGGIFGKKKKEKEDEGTPTLPSEPGLGEIQGDVEDTSDTMEEHGAILDEIPDKYKAIASAAGQLGAAIINLDKITLASIKNAIAAELQALAARALVKALEFGAVAVSAAVFGEWEMAGRAAAAAALWAGVAVAATAGAFLLGSSEGNSTANSQSSAAANAGTAADFVADKDKELLKQQALSVLIQLDIRTDDGIIIKKNIKAINKNTELTNLTRNSDNSWAFSPAP